MRGEISFQRRHFELIADLIRSAPLYDIDRQRKPLARHFAHALAATNPTFDQERFLTACGVED